MTYPQDPYGQQPNYSQPPPGYGYSVPPMGSQPQGVGGPTPQELSDASLAHYLGIIGIIGPIIYLLTSGQKSDYVRRHAISSLNFQLSFLAYYFASLVVCVIVGVVLAISFGLVAALAFMLFGLAALGLAIWVIVSCVKAGSMAKSGQMYSYPGAFNFLKD